MQNRRNETPRLQLRRDDRVYLTRGSWYIETREGHGLGPYSSKASALLDAVRLRCLLEGAEDEDAVATIVDGFSVLDRDVDEDASGGAQLA